MAFGRVNVLNKGGIENIKTTDYGKKGTLALIDFKRQRKIFLLDNKIYDFNDNVIAEMDSPHARSYVGFVASEDATKNDDYLYNLTTGKQVTPPKEFRADHDFILNEEMDYYKQWRGEIRDKEGNVLYKNLNMRRVSLYDSGSGILYVQNDAVYFLTDRRSIYCYKDRTLSLIADVDLHENKGLENINFL